MSSKKKDSTLFSYFKVKDKDNSNSPVSREQTKQQNGSVNERENKENVTTPTSSRKRPQIVMDEEDSEGEIGGHKNLFGRRKRLASMSIKERAQLKRKKKRTFESSSDDEDKIKSDDGRTSDDPSQDACETPPNTKKLRVLMSSNTPKTPVTPTTPSSQATPSTTSTPTSVTFSPVADEPSTSDDLTSDFTGTFPHEKLDFLMKEHMRDKDGKKVTDPDYCPRTLLVPAQYKKKLSPAMRQWWEIKSENFDTILFFKVGKFYELYHMDAVIGVRELNLVFMRGDFAHAGFPEVAFGKYSQTLVQKGHKVARIEQTETPQMMENRIKTMMISPSKFDRVVKREVCALISQGTRTVGFFEGESPNAESSYLLAIKENSGSCSQNETEFGVCFIDTCIGIFHLGQFTDDRQCSRLRTLLAHYPPVQLLVERGNLSFRSNQLLNQVLSLAVKDTLAADSEFWDCKKTLKYLSEEGYFDVQVPEQLQQMISKDDSLGMSPGDKYELALSSLGACIWTLKRSLIERDILLMNQFEEFVPLDELKLSCDSMSCDPGEIPHQRMILDDMALYNLGVISNEPSSAVGTLLHTIDKCSTLFGRRLLKQWISAPLCNPSAIDERLDAVDDLMTNQLLRCDIKDKLKSLPDMERLLRRIYMLGSDAKDENHPDTRAILFESVTYNKRKIKDFISLLNGFKNCLDIVELVNSHIHNISSKLLKKLITLTQDGGLFPDLSEYISFFNKAFDHDRALKEGAIFPNQGVNKEYDESLQEIEDVKNELQTYLQQQRKRLNCKNVVYWGNGRNRYQLEVPEHIEAPEEYELKSQKKGSLRYYTVTIENLLALLTAAEEKKDTSLRNSMKTIFNTFSQQFSLWDAAIRCIARVDVLVSMATYSASIEGSSCRPRVIGGEAPYIDIRQGKHPCITETFSGDDFIPNDAIINSQKTPGGKMCILVTGPNMGGKSTLMRQTGLLTILAHLGSHVPAECCHLSPVDRIFTRLGASDNIMHGESTFFVEANETSIILHHATINSLVLLDELGRGTATYDGTSIACAVLDYLANNISCRTLFSTHYHGLVNRFKDNPYVQLGHMACMADDEDDVTLLYKFMDGACPKSYGFNAARLAGVPPKVIELAKKKANEFELNNRKLCIFRSFVNKLITPSLIGRELQELCI